MSFSRPILIEHELTVSEEGLTLPIEFVKYNTNVKTIRNLLKVGIDNDYNDGDSLCAVFEITPDFQTKVHGKFSFYIKSANFVKHFTQVFPNEEDDDMCHELCTFDDLLNPEKKFMVYGQCIIQMKGILYREPSFYKRYQPTLGGFLRYRDDRDFIISVGKKDEPKIEIKIHKLVLASRSPVFDGMLKSGMKESIENKLEIVDFDADIVQAAVEYFYDQDDFIFDKDSELMELLRFADKYVVEDLKRNLAHVMFDRVNPTNISEFANSAILFNATELKDACLRLMINYIKHEIPFDNADTLDTQLSAEFLTKASMPTVDDEE